MSNFFIFIFLFFSSITTQANTNYTCPKIIRATEEVKWDCLKDAKPTEQFKSQMYSQMLLDHVELIEQQLGKQDVFIIARSGSSLEGFDHLKTYDSNGNPYSINDYLNFGKNQMNNKSVLKKDYSPISEKNTATYYDAITKVRQNISKLYTDQETPKLTYSHAGILFRTNSGKWNIYHELMPCNEKAKAYLFQDTAHPAGSSFFIDKPSKYKALVIPIQKSLQDRILLTIRNGHEFIARGPVYNAMTNPWNADTANSNSFILELIELALTPQDQYKSMTQEYDRKNEAYKTFMANKKKQYNVDSLSIQQKEYIESQDPGYRKVCRPEINIRRQLIQNYTNNGYQSGKVIMDSTFNFKRGLGGFFKSMFEAKKVEFLPARFVGEYMKPDSKFYKEHLALGIGETVTVKSIWDYLKVINMIHPKADPNLFEVPELKYHNALEYRDLVIGNIVTAHKKNKNLTFEQKDKYIKRDINNLDVVIFEMNPR